MSIYESLGIIQSVLNAPKNQRNTFGNYNYRSCEDIVEAVKPLLKEKGITLTLNDTVEYIGNRYYVKAIASIHSPSGEEISATAFAREEEAKKGMDAAQITGSASSYARKYALNGLFAIDDAKDSDTNENKKETDTKKKMAEAEEKKKHDQLVKALTAEAMRTGVPLTYFVTQGQVSSLQELRDEDMEAAIKTLKERPDKKK